MIDLHTHTTASDGVLTFEQLVTEAEKAHLKAIAITDHDNVCSALKIKNTKSKVTLIPGVELSVYDHAKGFIDIHVLGLGIDPKNRKLQAKLESLEHEREKQKKESVLRLNELGYELSFDEVRAKATGVIGRPHIAQVMVEKYPKEFANLDAVFVKLLGRGKPAYVDRKSGFTLGDAVEIVHAAGGKAFVAHPFLYPYDSRDLLAAFKQVGGDGVEVYYDYPSNSDECKINKDENQAIVAKYHLLASELGMLECGGSDFHNPKEQRLGSVDVPEEVLEQLIPPKR